jgi:hypothetical protein
MACAASRGPNFGRLNGGAGRSNRPFLGAGVGAGTVEIGWHHDGRLGGETLISRCGPI